MSLDFRKAYDSINRQMLVETLKKYKIDPRIIDLTVGVYSKDSTWLSILGEEREVAV